MSSLGVRRDAVTESTPESVTSAVKKATDDAATLHAILPTGESQYLRFYLVIWEVPHRDAGTKGIPEDATLLKERYFQVPKDDAPADLSPTFKSNGISRRDTGDLKARLVRAYARISNVEGTDVDDGHDPLWLDQSEG